MPFPQSRSRRFPIPPRRFPIPPRLFPNPVPGVSQSHLRPFSSDGSGSASFYRFAPAAALPHSRPGRFFLSPPPGFSPNPVSVAFFQSRSGGFPLRMGNDSAAAARRVSPHGTPKPFSPAQAAAPPDTPKPVPLCGHAALAKPPKPVPLARAGGFCTFRAVRGKRPFPRATAGGERPRSVPQARLPCAAAAPPGTPKPAPLARAGGFCTFRAVPGKRPFPRATAGGERPRSVPQARLPCAAAARRAVSGLHPAQIGTVSA